MRTVSHTERDEGAAIHATDGQTSRRGRALMGSFDPHPDDMLPPAQHLMPGEGVDVLAAFAAEVDAARAAVRNAR